MSPNVPNYFYEWRPGDRTAHGGAAISRTAHGGAAISRTNPYLGILSLADEVIVTADSIAMLSEVVATGKPLQMFDLGGMRATVDLRRDFRLGGLLYDLLLRWFWQPLSRDITLVHRGLVDSGRAVWLGDAPAVSEKSRQTDMQRAVAAIRELLGEAGVAVGVEQPSAAVD